MVVGLLTVCGGPVDGIFDINIPFDGSGRLDTPTDGGGCSDSRINGTSAGTIIPTDGGGRLDVRCRRDWGSSSTHYVWPSRSWARSPWWRWLPLRRTPSLYHDLASCLTIY